MNKALWILALIVAGATALVACKKPAGDAATTSVGKGWNVYRDGRLVEWIDDKPGRLTSAAIPRPGTPPTMHPFMTVSSMDVNTEGELAKFLDGSKSFQEYVENVQHAGYVVKPKTGDGAD